MNSAASKLIKTFRTGVDIGNTFFNNLHAQSEMLTTYRHEDLRIQAPKYFIDLLKDYHRMQFATQLDPDSMFRFMGIEMLPGPYEKVILYHVDYPLYQREDMIYELDLSIFVDQHT